MTWLIRSLLLTLAIVLAAAPALCQDEEPKPSKPSSKKKPASSKGKTKESAGDKTAKSKKPKREPRSRKDHPEPTDTQPDNLLDVHEDPVLEDLANQIDDLHAEITKAISAWQGKKAGKTAASKEMLEIGDVGASILRMERLAGRLVYVGEPLGADMFYRIAPLRAEYDAVFGPYSQQPGVQSQIPKLRISLAKESKTREKILPEVDKLCEADKWEEADELLAENLQRLEAMGAYFELASRPYTAINGKYRQVDEKMKDRVKSAAIENAQKALAADWPNLPDLLKQAQEAQASVLSTGAAQIDGKSLSGPEAIEQLGVHWRKAQIAAIRCQGLEWALACAKTPGLDLKKRISEHTQFDSAMRAALAGIVDADAQRASAEEAETLYAQYVQALAELAALSTSTRSLQDAADTALLKLAAKSERLKADAAAYRLATDDLLRWRERTAQAYARKQQAAFPAVEELLWGFAGNDGAKLGVGRRAVAEYNAGNALAKSTNVVLGLAGPPLLKAKVTATDLLGPRGERESSTSICQGLTFARLPAKIDCASAVDALAADLLVAASLPPLSLEAATALQSARSGDFQVVGGEVIEIGLHAVTPRLGKLTDADWGLVRLAPLWPVSAAASFDKQSYLRCDLRPAWVQHRCFYLELPAASQLSAAE